jgi:hypothetical protein
MFGCHYCALNSEFNSDWAHMSETVAKFGMSTLLPRRMKALDAWYRMLKMVAGFDISNKKRPGTRRQGRRGDARGLFQLRPWLSSSQYRLSKQWRRMPFLRVDLWTFVFEVDIPIFLSVFLSFLSFLSFGLGPVFRFRKKTDLTGTS